MITDWTPKPQRRRVPRGLLLPVIMLMLLTCSPLLYVGLSAYEAGWQEAVSLIFRYRVLGLLINTAKLSLTVTVICVVIGVSTAWLVERTDIPLPRMWNALVTLPFTVPSFVSGYSWISIMPSLEGFSGAVLVLTLSNYPLVHLPVAAALRGMDPALEETSRSLGYSRLATFWGVILPQLRVAMLGGAILIALHMLAEFGALSFVNYETFTTAIFDQYNMAFNSASAAMLTLVLLILCLGVIALERLLRGRGQYTTDKSGTRGGPEISRLGWLKGVAVIGLVALVVVAVGVPMGVVLYWLLTGTSSALISLHEVLDALYATLSLGLGGAILSAVFALPLVFLVVRYRGRAAVLADRLPYIIHSLPGLVIGLTLVFFAIRYVPVFYQTIPLLLLAYAMLYMPLAQSAIRAGLVQVPTQLEETARSLGKSGMGAFMTVTMPLITPGIGAGLALVFLEVMKELTATLLLRPTGVETLATEVWDHTRNFEYGASAPYAALLILASGVPVYILTMRSFTRGSQPVSEESDL